VRLFVFAFLAVACTCPGPPPPKVPVATPKPPLAQARTPALTPADPAYARLEGSGFGNDCQHDAACHVGGCSGEVCSAEEGVMSTCEVTVPAPKDASCGCVEGTCLWYWPRAGL
jgi:eight-cysteine-cluster-containing protein